MVEVGTRVARRLGTGVGDNTVEDGLVLVVGPVHQHVTDWERTSEPFATCCSHEEIVYELLQMTTRERSAGE